MTAQKDNKTVIVIGAGLSGIVSSYYLQKNGFQVTLIEKGDDIGGKMSSWEDPDSQAPYEHGYRIFFESYLNFFSFFSQSTDLKRDCVFSTSSHLYDLFYSTFIVALVKQFFSNYKEINFLDSVKTIKYFFSRRNSISENKLDKQLSSDPKQNLILRTILPAIKVTVGSNSIGENIEARTLVDACLFLFLNKDPFYVQMQPTRELLDIFKEKLISLGVNIVLKTQFVAFVEDKKKINALKVIDDTGEREIEAAYYIAALPCAEWKKPIFSHLPWSENARNTPTLWSNSLTICLRKHMPQKMLTTTYFPKADNPCSISFRFYTSDIWPLYDFSSIIDGTVSTVVSVVISDFFTNGLLTKKPMKCCNLEEIVKEVCHFAEKSGLFSINDVVPIAPNRLGILDPSLIYNDEGNEIIANREEMFGTNPESINNRQDTKTHYQNLFLASVWTAGDRYIPLECMETATISALLAVNEIFKTCDPNIQPLEIKNFFSSDVKVYHDNRFKESFRKVLLWIRGTKAV